MPKLCKDCKWYSKDWSAHTIQKTNQFDRCKSPNTNTDYVTGDNYQYCSLLRSEKYKILDYACGPEGKFWEAK